MIRELFKPVLEDVEKLVECMNKYRSYLSDVCDRMNVLHHSFSPARTSSDHMVVLVHEASESVPSEYQQLLLWETCMNLSILKSLLQKIGSKGGSGWSVYLCPYLLSCIVISMATSKELSISCGRLLASPAAEATRVMLG